MAYLSVFPVEILPYKVHSVDLAVMEVEDGLEWREVEITTGVTS